MTCSKPKLTEYDDESDEDDDDDDEDVDVDVDEDVDEDESVDVNRVDQFLALARVNMIINRRV